MKGIKNKIKRSKILQQIAISEKKALDLRFMKDTQSKLKQNLNKYILL